MIFFKRKFSVSQQFQANETFMWLMCGVACAALLYYRPRQPLYLVSYSELPKVGRGIAYFVIKKSALGERSSARSE